MYSLGQQVAAAAVAATLLLISQSAQASPPNKVTGQVCKHLRGSYSFALTHAGFNSRSNVYLTE